MGDLRLITKRVADAEEDRYDVDIVHWDSKLQKSRELRKFYSGGPGWSLVPVTSPNGRFMLLFDTALNKVHEVALWDIKRDTTIHLPKELRDQFFKFEIDQDTKPILFTNNSDHIVVQEDETYTLYPIEGLFPAIRPQSLQEKPID